MKRLIRTSEETKQSEVKAAQLQADLENTIGQFNTVDEMNAHLDSIEDELWEAIDNMDFEEDGSHSELFTSEDID